MINFSNRKKTYSKSDFNLKSTDIVYVHSGSIADWSGILDIIDAVENGLPNNTYIFIHSRTVFDKSDPIYIKLNKLKNSGFRLLIHDLYFADNEEYCNFLSCFDFGLVLYKPDGGIYTGLNIQEIGLASGKLSAYMLAKLPCLLSNCITYKQILDNYEIGSLVSEDYNLNYHIINSTLQNKSKSECSRFYETVLNPEEKLNLFIKNLQV